MNQNNNEIFILNTSKLIQYKNSWIWFILIFAVWSFAMFCVYKGMNFGAAYNFGTGWYVGCKR